MMRGRNGTERDIGKRGYVFFGHYASGTDGKEKMLARAKRYRDDGFYARVITKVYEGRIYNTEGYSVWIKPKTDLTNTDASSGLT